ncbi:hypothetical protein DPX16_16743 [Anabarilius grahami]|uniref:Uncharacterized protein n=1 Tax=Anabarilius grahami TaxID=495550 RepID=A0A3N0YTV2_ANAGA|nr:hypothetical protein DPX16_16743 [Anabarilius grahami]
MDTAPVLLMCLEQGTRSLEEHLMDYLFLAPLTTFPDDVLCSFLIAGLNISSRAQLSGRGPWGSFQEFVEWVLVSCGSPLTVGPVDDDASLTHNPVHNQDHPGSEDLQLEPTAGHVRDSAAMFEPAPVGATEPNNALEPEQHESDQPLCSTSASSQWHGYNVGLLGVISSRASGARGSASDLCMHHSTSTRRPDSHTCAPSTLGVSSDHRTFGFAGLPRYVGSASVRLHSTYATDLLPSGPPALHPFGCG